MGSSLEAGGEPNGRISALVNEFFDRRRAGEHLSPERFAAEHSEVAAELQPYLAGLGLADKVCTPAGDALGEEVASTAARALPVIEGYELVAEIGRGGMGVVYKALQRSTKRIVALKVMLAGPFASVSARRRFEREVELAARLRHPNIIPVLEGGRVAEQRYYAMDYVAGDRLDRYLSAAQPDVRTTLNVFVQICDAVEYAHGHGVIHRDLKPGNVLIDDEGNPHILDFGLAKATDQIDAEEALATRVSIPGQVLGTLFYLSPEQAAGATEGIDARTDVYALGAILFEALTGSLPFDTTGRPSRVIQRILEDTPARPSTLSNRVDGELETILLKALEKEKDRRYQSAAELAEDIRRYLAGEPILARRASSLYVLRKKLRKHRWRVAAGAVALVVVLGGMLYGMWSEQRQWADARRNALDMQRRLERGDDVLVESGTLRLRHPELVEADLVYAHALYRSDQPQAGVIWFLEGRLRSDPSLWPCRALLAELYGETGDAERAAASRAQAEREAPETAEACYLRSFATLDLERAVHCAQQAVQRQPSHVLAWRRLVYLRVETGDLDGALRDADRLIELGKDPRLWAGLKGRILVKQGRFREAVEVYTQAGAYALRAHAYRRLKEYDKAVADYTRALEAEGERAAIVWQLYQRATPLWILGRTDEAVADYRRVRVLLGRSGYSDARAFLILRERGDRREAEEVLDAALREVENPSWLRQIFRCLARDLTPEELIADGTSRNNLEWLCEAYYYAGEVCLLSGRLTQARQWFEQCVQTGLAYDPDTEFGTPMNEFELAQWRLETLFAEPPPTSQP